MEIAFTLTGEYAGMMTSLYSIIGRAEHGPRFRDPSELCRSLIEALLDDDARDNDGAVPN